MTSLTRPRSYYKRFRKALELPNPMLTAEDFDQLLHLDLSGMEPTALRSERQRILLALTMVDDEILHLAPGGRIITARGWLTKRMELIDRALRGAVD